MLMIQQARRKRKFLKTPLAVRTNSDVFVIQAQHAALGSSQEDFFQM